MTAPRLTPNNQALVILWLLFFFSSRRRHTRYIGDWSSDVCSSDLFDGASSAALFSRFYRERIRSDVQFEFTGLVHRAGALFDEKQFDGDENAIVDFKRSEERRVGKECRAV